MKIKKFSDAELERKIAATADDRTVLGLPSEDPYANKIAPSRDKDGNLQGQALIQHVDRLGKKLIRQLS